MPPLVPLGIGATLRELLGQIARFRLQAVLLTVALLIDVGYDTFLPLCLKFVIDYAIIPHDFHAFTWILSALGVAFLLTVGSAVGRDYLYAWLGAHVDQHPTVRANVLTQAEKRRNLSSASGTGTR